MWYVLCTWLTVVYLNQHLGAAHSKHWSKYLFLTFYMPKKIKKHWKLRFNQSLECTAPKRWSKYTTNNLPSKYQTTIIENSMASVCTYSIGRAVWYSNVVQIQEHFAWDLFLTIGIPNFFSIQIPTVTLNKTISTKKLGQKVCWSCLTY